MGNIRMAGGLGNDTSADKEQYSPHLLKAVYSYTGLMLLAQFGINLPPTFDNGFNKATSVSCFFQKYGFNPYINQVRQLY